MAGLLTSHRLSLSFYFTFMILSWWCFMSLCNEFNGFLYHLLLLGSEYVIPTENSIKVKNETNEKTEDLQCEIDTLWFHFCSTKSLEWRSNWSPWQQSKILSCSLSVDVVIIMLIQIQWFPRIKKKTNKKKRILHTYSHLCSLPPPATRTTA